jgi:hypothetical protein
MDDEAKCEGEAQPKPSKELKALASIPITVDGITCQASDLFGSDSWGLRAFGDKLNLLRAGAGKPRMDLEKTLFGA